VSVAVRTPTQELVAQVRSDGFVEQVKLALPEGIPERRFTRAAITALMTNTDLQGCTNDSILYALIQCAQTGLMPDGKQAALVKFKDTAVFMPMVNGFRSIAADHGWALEATVIYENDDFDYELGLTPIIRHRPARLGTERGQMIGAYAVATHKDGRKLVEVMDAAAIAKVRAVSRAKDSGPWRDWTERMWEKTPARRLFGKLPLGERDQDVRVSRVIQADGDFDKSTRLLYGPQARPSLRAERAGGDATSGGDLDGAASSSSLPAPDLDLSDEPIDDDPGSEEQETLLAIDDATRAMAMFAADMEVNFGRKYRGKTIADVAAIEPSYLVWYADKGGTDTMSLHVQAYVKTYLGGSS
jgi:recombination protein RecT